MILHVAAPHISAFEKVLPSAAGDGYAPRKSNLVTRRRIEARTNNHITLLGKPYHV